MSETHGQEMTAALTFKVPQKIGWSVRSGDQSWSGKELSGFIKCLATEDRGQPMALSISLIFEITKNNGTVQS